LGDLFETIISPEALIIIEHGTKIVNRQGKVIFGEFFSEREIDHVVDFTRANIELFKLAWFNPIDVSRKVQVWCVDEKDLQSETVKRGHYADVFTCSIGELEELLLLQRLTNVTLRLKDYVKVENLKLAFTRTDTNVIFQDSNMEFVKNNTNKGLAVEYLAKRLKVKNDNLLIAGNAINDVEMLDVDSGIAILVGQNEERSTILSYLSQPEKIITVDTPHDLGTYLLNI
jgi:hydroxymethylpyrimidine pyrophosphatase-like HAD family hydrolase